MITAQDISVVKLQTSDMDTSPDVLLATMAKIRKAQNQKLLDKVAQRERLIRQAAQRLVKLSPETNLQDLYDFMLQFEDGIFTGRYVTIVGSQYDLLQEKFRNTFPPTSSCISPVYLPPSFLAMIYSFPS